MRRISIYDEPVPVRAENGIAYRTEPTRTEARDGQAYILKGPQKEVVGAEAIGYALAALIGIPVPPCALCTHPRTSAQYFASQEMSIRSAEIPLMTNGVENPSIVPDCFAFDVWVANVDRNIGSFVADAIERKPLKIRAYSIDFEQCNLLRGVSPLMVTALEPRKLKSPDRAVLVLLRSCGFPREACERIAALPLATLRDTVDTVAAALGSASIPWRGGLADFLHTRAQHLADIAWEVWNA